MANSFLLCILSLMVLSMLANSTTYPKLKHDTKLEVYEIKKGDFSLKVTNWGARILSVMLPDSHGKLGDVALGYQNVGEYLNDTNQFGAIVGRVANRIANAKFVLDGITYKLFANDGNNTLHGGHRGFSLVFWTLAEKVDGKSPYIKLHYHSFDGEQGFPGALDVYVTYRIASDYTLLVTMEAKSLNKATPVNLAQHTYWNLGGDGSGTILSHTVQIFASKITPTDAQLIPTGKIAPVEGTPYDFLKPREVGSRIDELGQGIGKGYDINYVLDAYKPGTVTKVAVVEDRRGSGRRMEVWANQPGVQFYTGNYLNGVKGKNGHVYPEHGALCLETQGFPNAVNQPNFPSQIVKAGGVYKHQMVFKFSF